MIDRSTRARLPLFFAASFASAATLVWLGCGDDDGSSSTTNTYSPGGTWGAEIDVNVVGRGRVTSAANDLDCPSSCFAKYVFQNNAADGATGGMMLVATPTSGARFLGWSFTADPIGSRGGGPDPCNPVTRLATMPQVSSSSPQITLPYGQITGTPSDGGAGCSAFTNVPLAYHVTATFDTDITEQPDGAPLDSGSDAGPPATVAYTGPAGATAALDIGYASSVVFFHYASGGQQVIVEGTDPTFAQSTMPTTIATVSGLQLFKVFPFGAIYQDFTGKISVIRANSFSPTAMGGTAVGTCSALALDSTGNAYCHSTNGEIVEWTYPTYTAPTTLYSSVTTVNDLAVDTNGALVFATSTALDSLPANGDGGVATPTTVVNTTLPNHIAVGSARYAWASASTQVYASQSKLAPTSQTNTNIPSIGLVENVVVDPNDSTFFYAVGSGGVAHADSFGAGSKTVLSTPVQSAATDGTVLLYTMPNDAHVYRVSLF